MSRNTDFDIIAGLALVVGYANVVGPHKLVDQLFPGGDFILTTALRGLRSQHPIADVARLELPARRPRPAGRAALDKRPGGARRLPAPLAKPPAL